MPLRYNYYAYGQRSLEDRDSLVASTQASLARIVLKPPFSHAHSIPLELFCMLTSKVEASLSS
jgi:hypothetical protein